jgi:hypothetical protein
VLHGDLFHFWIRQKVPKGIFEDTLDLKPDSQQKLGHYRACKHLLLFLSLFNLIHALHYLDEDLLEVEIAKGNLVHMAKHHPVNKMR